MMLLSGISSAFFGATSAAGSAFAGGGIAGTLGTILQGSATVLGVMSALQAAKNESSELALRADDAEREQPLETLNGIQRRSAIKKELIDAQGAIDTAYAASGVDLSFGTASQAKSEAYQDADFATTMDNGAEVTHQSRLMERAANYRAASKRVKKNGLVGALTGGLQGAVSIIDRYRGVR